MQIHEDAGEDIAIYDVYRTSSRLSCKASCQDAVKASGKTAFMFIQ
jgi:hypothetical protein